MPNGSGYYPLEWWGEGRMARLVLHIDANTVYLAKMQNTPKGDRVYLSTMTIRQWKGWKKYHNRTDIEPAWYRVTQPSEPFSKWMAQHNK